MSRAAGRSEPAATRHTSRSSTACSETSQRRRTRGRPGQADVDALGGPTAGPSLASRRTSCRRARQSRGTAPTTGPDVRRATSASRTEREHQNAVAPSLEQTCQHASGRIRRPRGVGSTVLPRRPLGWSGAAPTSSVRRPSGTAAPNTRSGFPEPPRFLRGSGARRPRAPVMQLGRDGRRVRSGARARRSVSFGDGCTRDVCSEFGGAPLRRDGEVARARCPRRGDAPRERVILNRSTARTDRSPARRVAAGTVRA
jgi:hypothetical protein